MRRLRIKINNSFSRWNSIEYDVTQGPFLGPLLLNNDAIGWFYEYGNSNSANYADDTTLYTRAEYMPAVNKCMLYAELLVTCHVAK